MDLNLPFRIAPFLEQIDEYKHRLCREADNWDSYKPLEESLEHVRDLIMAEYVRQNPPHQDVQVFIDVGRNDDRVGGGAAMLGSDGVWYWTYDGKKTDKIPYTVIGWTYGSRMIGGAHMKKYEAELHYGWQHSHETYDTYHAFELTDPDSSADYDSIGKQLADLLDTTPEDEDFDFSSMNVKIPDSIVRRIQNDFINGIIASCGDDKEKAHEFFKLWWMLKHGYTISDLVKELSDLQYADPEDGGRISTPVSDIFRNWEFEVGFGGEIWPRLAEFLDCEYREVQNRGPEEGSGPSYCGTRPDYQQGGN